MKLTFLGAAGSVTGSKYLLTFNNQNILIECGLFQGLKKLRLRNWENLPINPAEIDAVLITHAHIDHSGYLPRLMKQGFSGPIYATEATFDLCSLLLPDCGYIQEDDARRANKYHYTKHRPALPLYTKQDAQKVLEQFKIINFHQKTEIIKGLSATWHHAGHILGASLIKLHVENKEILFSGDMGRFNDDVMKAPEFIKSTDYLLLESTYGDRLHDRSDPSELICNIINKTIAKNGTVLIPAFAVGRAQSLLYHISRLKADKLIPDIPVFLDSPLSINATELLYKHLDEHKLDGQICEKACSVAVYTNSIKESKAINNIEDPKIIISASGMLTGGRILHHLKNFGTDPKNTILITGYQAEGTRGSDLLSGRKIIKIHGEMVRIRADVEYITNLSAHADYEEILNWLEHFEKPPKKVYITHGEPDSALSLSYKIKSKFGWQCHIPQYLDQENL